MDFLVKWVAGLFSGFKAKNPIVAVVILLVLSAAVHTIHQGSVFGLFPVSGWLQTALEYISLFLTAATGSQTYQYLDPKASS